MDCARLAGEEALRGGDDERCVLGERKELLNAGVRIDVVDEQQGVQIAENRADLRWTEVDWHLRAKERPNDLLADVLPEHSSRRDEGDSTCEAGAGSPCDVSQQDRLADTVIAEGCHGAAAIERFSNGGNGALWPPWSGCWTARRATSFGAGR